MPFSWTTQPGVRSVLENYRKATCALRRFRAETFPTGSRVRVDAVNYEGFGVVDADSRCPITHLPVKLQNGNVWYYDLTDCYPID